ncbi:MAG: hypothetical protein PHW79_06090 [Candidatus Marinimicrobia bacterium]|nr:hypothetical protein [Candidatus Neomarinimicrobiota bacterium]
MNGLFRRRKKEIVESVGRLRNCISEQNSVIAELVQENKTLKAENDKLILSLQISRSVAAESTAEYLDRINALESERDAANRIIDVLNKQITDRNQRISRLVGKLEKKKSAK